MLYYQRAGITFCPHVPNSQLARICFGIFAGATEELTDDKQPSLTGFRELGIGPWLDRVCNSLGMKTATAVQRGCIPAILQVRHLFLSALLFISLETLQWALRQGTLQSGKALPETKREVLAANLGCRKQPICYRFITLKAIFLQCWQGTYNLSHAVPIKAIRHGCVVFAGARCDWNSAHWQWEDCSICAANLAEAGPGTFWYICPGPYTH